MRQEVKGQIMLGDSDWVDDCRMQKAKLIMKCTSYNNIGARSKAHSKWVEASGHQQNKINTI